MDTETPVDGDVRGSGSNSTPQPSVTKMAAVYLTAAFSALCLLSSVYLAANELAVPPSLWMKEIRVFDPAQFPANESINSVTARFANWLVEPGVDARFVICRGIPLAIPSSSPDQSASRSAVNCIQVIEDALKRMPASASLWFHHANWSALEGSSDEAINRSLQLSYQYGGREGWLAPRRLVFGLARWSELPEGLRSHVEMDVWMMLQSWVQLKMLVLIYNSNPAFKDQLVDIVERQATSEQKSNFAWLAEKASKGEPLP